jgi:hypothetical protein
LPFATAPGLHRATPTFGTDFGTDGIVRERNHFTMMTEANKLGPAHVSQCHYGN